ncbi:MAG: RluA family pseudouridine synthase [Chlamydiae bacterium]|nr:RluA family pseudouridine synthase [Chlamydiota bacterium]
MSFTVKTPTPILEALQAFAPTSSKNTLKKWLKSKRVFVNGHIVEDAKALLSQGSTLSLGPRKEYFRASIEILYEDSNLIVIYKPPGLLSVATDKKEFYTAHGLLKSRVPGKKVFPVHRLDKDTSGILVFAYTETARESLKKQFEEHSIYREYRAVLLGRLEEKKGTWTSYLKETASFHVYECAPCPEAMEAITHYEVLHETPKTSFVKFILKTGKKNQIRVQAAHRGFPVLGDKKYGTSSFERLALHAYALHFIHPISTKKLCFTYPYPKEFATFLPKTFP